MRAGQQMLGADACKVTRGTSRAVAAKMTKYQQIKSAHARAVEKQDANELRGIVVLLDDWGIKRRHDDGELLWTSLSMPTSIAGTIVIGYRYRKRDQSLTEDLFELKESAPNQFERYYKGSYEKVRAEYARTHKQQGVAPRSFTSVNTCCLYLGSDDGS